MKFTSFYPGFYVEDVEGSVKSFERFGFTVKHRTGGEGFSMVIMELPKGDKIAIIKSPVELGTEKVTTMINVDDIEEVTKFLCEECDCTKLGGVAEKPSTKFQHLMYDTDVITLMQHIK